MKPTTPKFFLQASKSTIAKARVLRKHMTPEERLLWSHLRDKSFGVQFRKQVPFGPYILDFFCLAKKVAVELDGDQHYEEETMAYDKARDEYLRSHEITVLRIRNRELKTNLDGVLTVIWNACKKEK
ncbi:MAG: endonuclease domain-containing protein [Ignavibacteriales bacterium]|nr:endonuclease domain-containing protein [Ignavibacteriales bacterium]